MADSKLTGLTGLTSPTDDDLMYIVDDPGGTPASKSVTVGNLKKTFGGTPVDSEIVSGSGTSWTLASTPVVGSVRLFGQRNRLYPGVDYSISGAVITTTLSYSAGDLLADYRI